MSCELTERSGLKDIIGDRMKGKAILLLIAYLLVVFHGLIPHHHHGDVLPDKDVVHVHEFLSHSHEAHVQTTYSAHSHYTHGHSSTHKHWENNTHSHDNVLDSHEQLQGVDVSYDGIDKQLIDNKASHSHHHDHFHFLSNGFAHVERAFAETNIIDLCNLQFFSLLQISKEDWKYCCRDDGDYYIDDDIACPQILFNNVKTLRGPPLKV